MNVRRLKRAVRYFPLLIALRSHVAGDIAHRSDDVRKQERARDHAARRDETLAIGLGGLSTSTPVTQRKCDIHKGKVEEICSSTARSRGCATRRTYHITVADGADGHARPVHRNQVHRDGALRVDAGTVRCQSKSKR